MVALHKLALIFLYIPTDQSDFLQKILKTLRNMKTFIM